MQEVFHALTTVIVKRCVKYVCVAHMTGSAGQCNKCRMGSNVGQAESAVMATCIEVARAGSLIARVIVYMQ